MNDMMPGAAPGGADEIIKSGDIKSFGADVIAASRTVPVIVDFWADWCGPCKQLMPMLEQAVRSAGGAVRLVKVNADQNQTLCAQLQVQSLPTVLAFWQGQPVDGFQGAVPQSQIKTFIDRLVQMSGGAGEDDPLAAALEEAERLQATGETVPAAQLYQRILQHDGENKSAMIGLAECALTLGQPDQIETILAEVGEDGLDDKLKARVKRLKTALEIATEGKNAGDPAALEAALAENPMDHATRFQLALAHQGRGNMEEAADALLGIIMRDREWQDDAARKQLVKLFEAAGTTDPFTLKYRRRLSSVLFS